MKNTIILLTIIPLYLSANQTERQKINRDDFAQIKAILFDVDLTQGDAGGGAVTGGVWQDGWKVTEGSNQRIVYDCGYNIANGAIEATFTIDTPPFVADNKANYFGAYEDSSLEQRSAGDKVYLRSGKTSYAFSRIKAFYKPIIVQYAGQVWEHNIGENYDWKFDGETLHTVRITWQNGTITYTGTGGTASRTYSRFDALRYVFLGAGKSYGFGLVGQKFKSVKIVELDSTATAIDDRDRESSAVARVFKVAQNYPNPFNPSTSIHFVLPSNGLLQVVVYDIVGRQVATLADRYETAGEKTLVWHTGNQYDARVSSGVYFYQVRFEGQVVTKKMIFMQ